MTREKAAIDYCLFIGNTSLDEVDAFEAGVEWEHKIRTDKACEWLEKHINDDKYYSCIGEETLIPYLLEDFRKAMEE